MSDMTAQQMITTAYRKIGITVGSNSAKLEAGLEDLQNMLSLWSVQGLFVPNNVTEILTLTIGQAVYTIGKDGSPDFSTVRPARLVSGFFRIDTTDRPVNVNMTQGEYDRIYSKALEARPCRVYYNPQYPNAKLQFDREADVALAFHLTSEKPLVNPATLATTFSIPLEYNEPTIYNLAIRLTPDKNTKIHPSVALMAERGMEILENYNAIEKLSEPVLLDRAITARSSRSDLGRFRRGF